MEAGEKMEEDGKMTTLEKRQNPNSFVKIAKNLGLRSLAWIGVYLLGYFNFSIGWMVTPLLFSVLRDQWKKEKRNRLTAARESALTNEQAMIEHRMDADDLPSWVFFPDKDRAEWVNNILKQLWPYVNEYVRKTLFDTVEPAVDAALRQYKLNPFKFDRDRVFLGQVPPRITGVKVYDENTGRKEIIMDLDIVLASDMELEFKVKGIAARVSDFALRGMLRVVLKPLVSQIPLIGGVQVYFLKAPEIDYSMGGVAGALEIPGLNRIVENIIIEQVKNFIVLPNKFSMPLVKDVLKKTLKCPDSAGVLRCKLIRAKGLIDKDGVGSGKSDPYAILTVGAHTHRAPTIMDNLNPEWNIEYDFPIEVVQGQELLLEFYDDDSRRDDEFLGRAKIQTSVVAERGHIDNYWVDLVDCEQGSVQVSLSWLPVTDDPVAVKASAKQAKDDQSGKDPRPINVCLIHLYIDACSGLVDPRDPSYKCSPIVQLVNGQEVIRSWPKYYTNDPVIEQGFVMLIRSPYTDEIIINVIDAQASKKKNEVIGTTSIRVWSLIDQPEMEYPLQPFLLNGNSPNAVIHLSMSLRGLLPPGLSSSPKKSLIGSGVTGGSESEHQPDEVPDMAYDDHVKKGQIRVVVHRADDLPRMDLNGKADPYVVLTYGDKKEKTKSCKNTLDPVWDHELFLDVEEFGENQIKIEVFDKDRLGKDELMGLTNVDVRRISKQGSLTEMWDNLIGAKKGRVMWSMTFTPAETESVPPPSSPPGPIQTPDPIQTPYKPTPSPYKEENPVKRTGEPPRPNLEQEMNSPQPDEELIRVKRDPQDYEEPIKAYKGGIPDTGSVPEFDPEKYKGAFSEPPAAVDQLGYMSRVMSGFLRVTVHKGEDLMDLDFGGKSDPYVVIKYASQINKSKTVKGSLNPEFEFSTGYVIEDDGPSELWIELFDKDIGKDESLGHVKFDIRALVSEGDKMATWATLQNAKRGRIQVSLDYSPSGYNDGPSVEEEIHPYIPQMPAGDSLGPAEDEFRKRSVATQGKIRLNLLYDERREELKVFVHEVAGLPGGHLKDPPDPQVKLYLMPGRKKKKTEVVKDCVDPKFDEEFDFSIDYDQLPKHEIKICVVDRKGMFSKSPVLGSKTISLNNPGLRQGLADWFTLEDGDEDSD